MEEPDSGFSFGAPRPEFTDDGDDGEVDAIEVGGDPVSRKEAKNMGLVSLDAPREKRSETSLIRLEQLPPGVSEDMAKKLEKAWSHLKRNEIQEALTLAQEVVWNYPSLVAAKVIIARCFINRKEYDKALAILQAIEDEDKTAEVYYYIGLCLSRSNRLKEAIIALKQSRKNSTDPLIRKRASDLLLHLQGEQTTCPVCGRKVLYDSLVDVGNQSVCTNCAKEMEDRDDDEYDEEELLNGSGRRRRKLRRPLTKMDVLIRSLFAVFILVVLYFVLYVMNLLMPETYGWFRSKFPQSWFFLPRQSYATPVNPPQREDVSLDRPRVIPTMTFDSPPIERAIADVEIRHMLHIEGMESRDGVYHAVIVPDPDGPYSMNQSTGEFVWTPSRRDAGKTFRLTFYAVFGKFQSRDQINTIKVSPGPEYNRIAQWPTASPGAALHLWAEDMDGDDRQELLLFSGKYWEGDIFIFKPKDDDTFEQVSHTPISGRPVGAGVIRAGNEKWFAFADYWNRRIRYFAKRNGSVSEMALAHDLPGRPVLAAFDRDSSVSAALCHQSGFMTVVAYKQDGQINAVRIGEWRVPEDVVWRKLVILPDRTGRPQTLVLFGSDIANTVYVLEAGKPEPRILRQSASGVITDAALCGDSWRVVCLVETNGLLDMYTFNFDAANDRDRVKVAKAGPAPALCGLVSADLMGRGVDDIVSLGSSRMGFALGSVNGNHAPMTYWSLPAPARLFGEPVVMNIQGRKGGVLVFADETGGLWTAGIAD